MLTFTNKEEYLKWRSEWRARYAQISQDIRDLTLVYRISSAKRWDAVRERSKEICSRFRDQRTGYVQTWLLWSRKKEARQMLEERKQSKLRAQENYLQRKASLNDAVAK